jgi:hypothetical protein
VIQVTTNIRIGHLQNTSHMLWNWFNILGLSSVCTFDLANDHILLTDLAGRVIESYPYPQRMEFIKSNILLRAAWTDIKRLTPKAVKWRASDRTISVRIQVHDFQLPDPTTFAYSTGSKDGWIVKLRFVYSLRQSRVPQNWMFAILQCRLILPSQERWSSNMRLIKR